MVDKHAEALPDIAKVFHGQYLILHCYLGHGISYIICDLPEVVLPHCRTLQRPVAGMFMRVKGATVITSLRRMRYVL